MILRENEVVLNYNYKYSVSYNKYKSLYDCSIFINYYNGISSACKDKCKRKNCDILFFKHNANYRLIENYNAGKK